MANHIQLGNSELSVSRLCLGGNVFGWTANEAESFAVLDAFVGAGGNFIDTADMYSCWVPGNSGGESERIIGNWMRARGNRDQLIIATKVAKHPARSGLSAANIALAAEESLDRLQTDRIDLYYAHADDESVPQGASMEAFFTLVRAGKVRALGASNFSGARLRSAQELAAAQGEVGFVALQNQYNLLERKDFESELAPLLAELAIASVPYYALASGYLTGKYRGGAKVDSPRAGGMGNYDSPRAVGTVELMAELAEAHSVSISAIALAWLRAKGSIPIASARNVTQLAQLVQIATLSAHEVERLDLASA
jgi:aryl-alcohol dehydrogenase-like predicted oxidoreductase